MICKHCETDIIPCGCGVGGCKGFRHLDTQSHNCPFMTAEPEQKQ
jgi:hypothetical protein